MLLKRMIYLLLLLTGIWAGSGCTKTEMNAGLDGTWQLTACYYGYANGGNNQWNAVPGTETVLLEFAPEGRFQRTDLPSQQTCTGTWQFLPGNVLGFSSSCNTVMERFQVLGIAPGELVLGMNRMEGPVRYRYQRIR